MSEGELTVGQYELRNCVATGNSSQVWEVAEQGTPNQFAMKLLLPEAFAESAQKSVLKHEFKVGNSFEHPNFVTFHKIEVSRDHAFFIMDYFRAPSLKAQIASDMTSLHIRARKLIEALILALSHMHEKGWLHRDIKPENILFNKGSELRLIDFSLSSRVSGGLGKLLGGKLKIIQGTRTYIAPETLQKQKPTEQTDMYSMGITIYEVLCGQPPFTGTSPDDLLRKHVGEAPPEPSVMNPNLTPEVDQFLLKLLSKKPKDRPADMKEVYAEFRSIGSLFKEDPEELAEQKRKEAEEEKKVTVDQRLDSRADAERTAAGIPAPARRKKKKPVPPPEPKKETPPVPQQPAPGQMPVMPPGQMPMPPGMPPGYQPMPGYPTPVPGQPMPPGMPPQYMPQPPYPQAMPGQQPMMPAAGMPGMPMAPGQPVPGQPMPAQPMPGQPMPGQPMPGHPVPGQPPQSMPGQPAPGQPPPPSPGYQVPPEPAPVPQTTANPLLHPASRCRPSHRRRSLNRRRNRLRRKTTTRWTS